MQEYDAKKAWTSVLTSVDMPYPSEYVIRILKGSYPKLNLDKSAYLGRKICDVGCGPGRNFPLLAQCGFDVYGVEIAQEIIDRIKDSMDSLGIHATVAVGSNNQLPFSDRFFDYLLSWNACYYMGSAEVDFNTHVVEFARVLKDDGYLILSVPKISGFIFRDSKEVRPGYRMVLSDPFQLRNGEIMRAFRDSDEIIETFQPFFKNFIVASVEDDCFGLAYHFHLIIAQKTHI